MQATIPKYSLFILFNLFYNFHFCSCRDVVIVSPSPYPEEECDVSCYNHNNVSISCNLIDCNAAVNVSSFSPSAPAFTTSDVSYYIYNTSLQEKHLALNTKWTFKYDQTLPWITGYRARLVLNDVLQEEICVDISRTLEADDVETYFSYNCFGRHDVRLEPNNKYLVEIESLPLSTNSHSHSLTKVDYTMPECVVDEVNEVAECNLTPVSKELSTDCSSIADGKYPVDCQVLAINEDAEDVWQYDFPLGNNGPPSSPSVVYADQQWYTFYDSESKTIKIALNVSWSPSDDSSIGQLHAYEVQVLPMFLTPPAFSIYNISTPLTFAEHIKVEFIYDYFGRTLHSVEPGKEYKVIITSLPKPVTYNQTPLYIDIKIPDCADQRLRHVTYCKDHNPDPISIVVDEVSCYNRSVQLTYNAPLAYGNDFTRLFCKLDKNQLGSNCHVLSNWQLHNNKATLYDIRLPPDEPFNETYFVSIRSNGNPHLKVYRSDFFNFTKCIEELKPINSTPTYIIAIAVCAVITICCLSIIVFIMHQKSSSKYQENPVPMSRFETVVTNDNRYSNGNGKEAKPPAVTVTKSKIEGGDAVRVFVVYTNDCEKHLNVMHYFCSFLREDLQLNVNTFVWERNEANSNPLPWMTSNLEKADKVIVICSEGSKPALRQSQGKIDHFAPVVNKIIDHNFIRKNVGKYLYAYFDYSSEDHIPDQLQETSAIFCSQFKLMKQFEELYFRLVNKEQYQEGKIMRIDKIGFDQYYDISSQNSHGAALKNSIDEMSRYVELNPTWFTDLHGDEMPVSTFPLMPLPTREERSISYMPSVQMSYQPTETEGEERPSIQILSIVAPPENNVQIDVDKNQQQPQSEIMKHVKSSPHLKREILADLDEDFSIHPKRKQTTCIGKEPDSTIPLLQAPSARTPVENYCQPLVSEVSKRSNEPPSHMIDYPDPQTMETILPIFDEPHHDIQGSEFTDSFHPDSFTVDFQGGSFQGKLAATELNMDSGVFTLAQIDGDDIDIDDEFQSINQTSMGQFRDI